ncbi:hypothetical protein RhiirA1_495313 [Rhizophagus irregularis]|nr:hypothetical protein GLOIN_2v1768408 [Rhizophagus irregularis DAOM 181602=DAOM 197198]EXX72628.1 hypothetical protein RirG_067540 [Rhizophagus irregularis DAOM 197198w]PKC71789.1 hypothetical protein RhiirA1_495313 [Rhizophagus irregularis]PKY16653.1 hypothetical protein RhiirB3_381916 [Rhizophagus irregularis]POG76943.1 hypothetical protein GLOIN_2v1768408 [Rhizophagus irregularis DAOM 181602=DAOM 197198]UZO03692.1 hypothetical protein OCT59_024095 [Rhizophagus irregularis]|eukprot:XP_025183809.1 hypothetical protein GLOIN_2v1768408 [Rhizophagus irregularis DAOM 181602=DAOM 197198]
MADDSGIRYFPCRVTRSQSRQSSQQSNQLISQPSDSSQPSSQSSQLFSLSSQLTLQPTREKRLHLSSAAINSAGEKLLSFQKAREVGKEVKEEEEEGYTGSREIVIKENVSLEKYLQYRENNAIPSVRMYLHNGNIIIYEVPSFVHGVTAGRILVLMGGWNNWDFAYGTEATMILGPNTAKESDFWVRPRHLPDPPIGSGLGADRNDKAYPTMMIEVGFSQSLLDLHRKTVLYFSPRTTIQIVLAIKIFGVRTDPNTNTSTIALIAALYLRTSATPLIPTSVISFGTADPDANTVNCIINQMGVPPGSFTGVGRPDPNNNNNNFPPCNAPNLPDYQMNIPGPELYNGVPVHRLPPGFAAGFNLDLWDIRNEIEVELRI